MEEKREVSESNLMAGVCYAWLLVLLPMFSRWRKDSFVAFHLSQGVGMLLLVVMSLIVVRYDKLLGNAMFLGVMLVDIAAMAMALRGERWKIPIVYQLTRSLKF